MDAMELESQSKSFKEKYPDASAVKWMPGFDWVKSLYMPADIVSDTMHTKKPVKNIC
jgi:hypothetical protein